MPKKQSAALGKGLDALIGKDYAVDSDKLKEIEESEDIKADLKDVNERIINEVLNEVQKNPRISLWSPKSAAVLRFLKKTKPEFSISNESSKLIEQAVKDKYPEIWEIFSS
ncbi:MAG: hypothetical protein FJ150_02245 [Euryarchaeota archaeon]|nr:hypothetical protein [Euryarchaeota archaeon]